MMPVEGIGNFGDLAFRGKHKVLQIPAIPIPCYCFFDRNFFVIEYARDGLRYAFHTFPLKPLKDGWTLNDGKAIMMEKIASFNVPDAVDIQYVNGKMAIATSTAQIL